jgi:biopolymer transport protein ExbD
MSKKRNEPPPIEPTLPVTPMLDMTFQLFAFFVFTYHPQSLEGKLDFSLPATGEFKAKTPDQVDPSTTDTDVDLNSEFTVEVKTATTGETRGNINDIVVKTPQGETHLGSSVEALRTFLKANKPAGTEKTDIKIACDSVLKYGFTIEVMDVCKHAGFDRVGFAPPPDLASFGP